MCVIINKPKGVVFPESDIALAFANNPDGFGMVYYDPEKDRIVQRKGVTYTLEEVQKMFKETVDYDTLYHFRVKTRGAITRKQAHPFQVLQKETHGMDMFFAHNGTITGVKEKDDTESDTMAFNRTILKPLLKKFPNLIKEDAFHELVMKFISSGSKLVFMYGKGETLILNVNAGAERHGCWVSNEYSFRPKTTATTAHSNYTAPNTANSTNGAKNNGHNSYTPYAGNRHEQVDFLVIHGMVIRNGGNVWVMSNKDRDFWGIGKVTHMTTYSFTVEFSEEDSKSSQILGFDSKTGDSFVGAGTWSVVSEELQQKDTVTTADNKTPTNICEVESNNVCNIADQKKTPAIFQQLQLPSLIKEATKKGQTQQTTSQKTPTENTHNLTKVGQTTGTVTGTAESDKISYKGLTTYSTEAYGGYFVEPLCEYNGVTFEDVFNYTRQQRLEFFMDNQEDAFEMFSDLINYVNIQDEIVTEGYEDLDQYTDEEIFASMG